MKKVKLVYDRKKRSAQTGLGKIEIRIYLGNGEIKFITVGTASPDTWEIVAQQPTIIKKVHQCEQVIKSTRISGRNPFAAKRFYGGFRFIKISRN